MKFCPECSLPTVVRSVEGRDRFCCDGCGFIHYEDPKLVAVTVVPIDGKLVLGRRSINPRKGYWSFPSGYVNRGETVEMAASREVREETCLEVEMVHLLGLYSEPDNPIVLAVFAGRVTGGALGPGDEVSEVGLFAPDQLPQMAFPNDARIVGDWLAYVRANGSSDESGT